MVNQPIKILILGASGMLGNALLRFFTESIGYVVYGSVRTERAKSFIPKNLQDNIFAGVDVENFDSLTRLFAFVRPDVVVNCVGLVKQLAAAEDVLSALPINSLLPHRLARLCEISNCRLVHMSTDCVFSGHKGMYVETDIPDASDLYGRSKHMGEVDYQNAITLRTSIIGHELDGERSLINWFLAQKDKVKGFKKAIFSGLPTVEVARVIRDYVIPNPELHGLYHLSVDPISKFDLLTLVNEVYGKNISIVPDHVYIIDRSLDSSRFQAATGFKVSPWRDLIMDMYKFS